jgi:Ca-activated chloride channel family protein
MPFELHWLRPQWLWLLPLLMSLLVLLGLRVRQSRRWEDLVDAPLRPFVLTGARGARPAPLLAALGLCWLLVALALAGPAWQRVSRPVFRIEQPRVLLLDLSVSMQAVDVAPSRLARARFEVMDLLRGTDEGQFALIVFGAEPFLIAPLTTDAGTIVEQVPLLEPAVLPISGERRSDLALEAAARLLRRSAAAGADVVLVTDAVAPDDRTREAAAALAAAGHRVSVLGLVPNAGFAAVAAAGGGIEVAARPDDQDTTRLLALQGRPRASAAGDQLSVERQWRDDGPWLLLLAAPLAALAFRRGWLGAVPLVLLLTPPMPAQAGLWSDLWLRPEQQAMRAADAGRLDAAVDGVDDPRWRAALRYRGGDYAGALEALTGLQGAESHYNRGNVLARLGRFEDAVAEYDAALALAPDHVDAGHNRRLLLELMQQQRPEPTATVVGDTIDGPDERGAGGDGEASDPATAARGGGADGADGSGGAGADGAPASAGMRRGDAGGEPRAAAAGTPPGRQRGTTGTSVPARGQGASEDEWEEPAEGAGAGRASDGRASAMAQTGAAGGTSAPLWQPDRSQDPSAAADAAADAYLLQQVPDDPGRLLRERLMLQYLRRHGQLH